MSSFARVSVSLSDNSVTRRSDEAVTVVATTTRTEAARNIAAGHYSSPASDKLMLGGCEKCESYRNPKTRQAFAQLVSITPPL